ncbi:MAG: putative lipid II flippase FtsW [bacterium]|nr:putative lipid II flippase FtsW [bacterium]
MKTIDRPFLIITGLLVIGGIFILSSASIVVSQRNLDSLYGYTLRHVFYAVIVGGTAFWIAQRIPYRTWKKISPLLLVSAFILLGLVFFPGLGFSSGGATRWLNFKWFTVQPAEFLKLALIVYLASWLDSRKYDIKKSARLFIPFVVIMGAVAVFLILQPDIGTLLVVGGSSALLYFFGGGKLHQLIAAGLLGLLLIITIAQISPQYNYLLARLDSFRNPEEDPQGAGYQIRQSAIAIGSGGFWGVGFGQSRQKYSYLPEPMNDSIFAIFTEEVGFLGVILLVLLFLSFLWRGFLIARNSPDFFGRLLVIGIVSGITLQAFINMGAISGLLPLTGVPLPFISYGGSALVAALAGAGIVANVSKYT